MAAEKASSTALQLLGLEGKRAIVTGGASGIGLATARLFADLGAKVFVGDLRGPTHWSNIVFHELDVRDSKACEAFAREVCRDEPFDILVNSAGVVTEDDEGAETEKRDRMFGVNVEGTLNMCRVAEHWMAKGGSIVNVGSVVASQGWPHRVAYCATKGAVHAATRAIALKLIERQIRVNAIAPGLVATPMIRERVGNDPNPEHAFRFRSAQQATGRMLEPEEVARAILFLVSHMSAGCIGSELDLTGGRLAGHVPNLEAPGPQYSAALDRARREHWFS